MEGILSNSQAILYLSVAFCVLWLTVFLLWFVYYLIALLRPAFKAARLIERKIAWWHNFWQSLRKIIVK